MQHNINYVVFLTLVFFFFIQPIANCYNFSFLPLISFLFAAWTCLCVYVDLFFFLSMKSMFWANERAAVSFTHSPRILRTVWRVVINFFTSHKNVCIASNLHAPHSLYYIRAVIPTQFFHAIQQHCAGTYDSMYFCTFQNWHVCVCARICRCREIKIAPKICFRTAYWGSEINNPILWLFRQKSIYCDGNHRCRGSLSK